MRTAHSFFACTALCAKPWRLLAATLLAMFLAACSSPPKPVVTTLQMSVVTAADTNPDVRKRPSPVVVRIYALKSSAAFDSADFFSLFDKDTATLGADLVQKEEFLMTPGQQKTVPFAKFDPDVKAIAVMAAFRDLERARWRAVQVLDVGKSLELTAKLSGSQIVMEYKVLAGLPNLPKTPELPKAPDMPKAPEMPKMPEMPKAPEVPKMPTLPSISR